MSVFLITLLLLTLSAFADHSADATNDSEDLGVPKASRRTTSTVVHTQLVCEHNQLNLHCSHGTIIHVVSANYGRTDDGETCPHRSIKDLECSAETSVDVVTEACEGEESCSVRASNSVFGDPCVGTFKYLEVEYYCRTTSTVVHTQLVCEHNRLNLQCSHGKNIHVVSANYGRTDDGETCPHRSIKDLECSAETSVDVVTEACEGEESCSVRASNSVFGDPCVGTFKYLEVKYYCRTTSTVVHSQLVCEHNRLNLQCSHGKNIHVVSANYGRTDDGETCPHRSIKDLECSAETSVDVVTEACEGEESCSVRASNSVFGDPCVGTFKYLEVEYYCSTTFVHSRLVCEHNRLNLQCSHGKIIHVVSANYGRTDDGETCPHRSIKDLECRAETSVDVVTEACEGEESCSVRASNSVFGDPCVGTFKYLEVEYYCVSY
ncbi:rhamnose-binding lectin-like [Glandiceps talaboti]